MTKKADKGTAAANAAHTVDNAANANTTANNVDNAVNSEPTLEQLKAQLKAAEEQLKEAKAREAKAAKKPRYTRGHALIQALKTGGDRDRIVELIDQYYKEHGGQANKNGALTMVSIHVPVFKLAGLVTEDKNGLHWSGPEVDFDSTEFREV